MDITRACAQHMILNGIYQWNEAYPNPAAFKNDISRNELFVYEESSKILGCISISTHMDEEYVPVKWLSPNQKNLYIHRLAVHPDCQGQGYAQKLMSFAEEEAKTKGYISIRLDTFSQNFRNQKFYELRGYKRLGNVYFPNQSEHPFYCYELVL
jgi:ribosomal protein S18 acetylase RimI-like enzyme